MEPSPAPRAIQLATLLTLPMRARIAGDISYFTRVIFFVAVNPLALMR